MSTNIFVYLFACIGLSFGAQFSSVVSLYDHLVGKSYKYVRPEMNLNTATLVGFQFNLVNLQALDENEGLFSVAAYLQIAWRDNNLKWNSALFDGESGIRLPTSVMWTPHLIVGNPYDKGHVVSLADSTVTVNSHGEAYWYPAASFRTACDSDVTYYPFDSQTCTVMIVPWQYDETEIAVGLTSTTVDTTHYSVNPQWDYVTSNVYNVSNTVYISMTFKRRPTFFMVNVMFPIILMSVLNLFVFVLPAASGERIGFSITLLLSVAIFMTVVADSMPSTSSPRLAIVSSKLIGDLTISGMMVVCCIFVLRLHHKDDSQPVTKYWRRLLECKRRICKSNKNKLKKKMDVTVYGMKAGKDIGQMKTSASEEEIVKISWKEVQECVDYCCLIVFSIVLIVANAAFFLDIVTGIS